MLCPLSHPRYSDNKVYDWITHCPKCGHAVEFSASVKDNHGNPMDMIHLTCETCKHWFSVGESDLEKTETGVFIFR